MRRLKAFVGSFVEAVRNRTWQRRHVWAIHCLGMASLGLAYLFGSIVILAVAIVGGTFFLLIAMPMTDVIRKQARHQARSSSLVQHSSDLVALIAADMTIDYVSPSVRSMLGYKSLELQNTSFTDLVRPDDLDRLRGSLGRC